MSTRTLAEYDVIVNGLGIAGLSSALAASEMGHRVLLLVWLVATNWRLRHPPFPPIP